MNFRLRFCMFLDFIISYIYDFCSDLLETYKYDF
jgi:hypothetical protein